MKENNKSGVLYWIRLHWGKIAVVIVFVVGVVVLPYFVSSKRNITDKHIHSKARRSNDAHQERQCRMIYCTEKDRESCIENNKEYKECVNKMSKKADKIFGK